MIPKRIAFKTMAEGFRHKQVNSAYTSQACPLCDFVDRNNRTGDKFCCLHCKHEGHADRIAANNIFSRLTDPEITLHSSVAQVKVVLLKRFNRRLEMVGSQDSSVTVSGRTSERKASTKVDTAIYEKQRKPRPQSQQGGLNNREPDGQSKSETQ